MSRALALTFVFCAVLLEWDVDHSFVYGQPSKAVTHRRGLDEQTSDANEFFDGVEKSVETIADYARSNYRNRQDLWDSTGTCTMGCSVLSCRTRQLSVNDMCLKLPENNSLLPDHACTNGNVTRCSKATFSSESYVRLPGMLVNPDLVPYKLPPDQQMTICAQKQLDQQIFPNIYSNSSPLQKTAWSMFGASNGVFRIFPGLELQPDVCQTKSFDPRKRPWYKAITGISKQVVILLDTGGLMASSVSNTDSSTVFQASQRIVVEFLDTLSTNDVVSVYTFGSTRTEVDLVNSNKTQIPGSESNSTDALQPLKEAIQEITVTRNAPPANLTAALETVLLDGGFDTTTAESLKVILIITRGKLAEGSTLSIPSNSSLGQALNTQQVRTFIYQWKKEESESNDLTFTDLESAACALNASYDQIPRSYTLSDPLSALKSFYSYVAKIRFTLAREKPLWVPSFGSFTDVSDVMSVIYPVFDGDFLVGVACIDVLRDIGGPSWENVINERKNGDIQFDRGPALNCSVRLNAAEDLGLVLSDPEIICSDENLHKEDYITRTCCDPQCHNSRGKSKANAPGTGTIIGVSTAGVFLTVLLFCLFYWWTAICRLCNKCIEKKTKTTKEAGNGKPIEPNRTPGSIFDDPL